MCSITYTLIIIHPDIVIYSRGSHIAHSISSQRHTYVRFEHTVVCMYIVGRLTPSTQRTARAASEPPLGWPFSTRYCFTSRLYCTIIFFANTPFIVQYIAQYCTSYCNPPAQFCEVFLRCFWRCCFVFKGLSLLRAGFWMCRGV